MSQNSERQNSEQSTPEADADVNKTPDLKTLRHLHTDLQHSHTETLQTFNDISQKSGRLLQFNGTILAILAGAATLVESNISTYINLATVIGIGLVVFSILILLGLHKTESVFVGVGDDEREIASGESDEYPPLNEPAYLIWINQYYANWVHDAVGKNKTKGKYLFVSEVCTVAGILILSAGILIVLLQQ